MGERKPPTVFDVAEAAGVSTATVSRVLNRDAVVLPATAERVLQAVRTLGYTPSAIGRSLRSASTRVVALLMPDVTNCFCADVGISVERALQKEGLSMVLGNTAESPDLQDRLLSDVESLRPRAIVLLGGLDTPKLRQLARSSRRLVFVSRRPPPSIEAPFIGIDYVAAGRAVAHHLLDRGYTDCAIIHGPIRNTASLGRLDGFLSAMAERGVPVDAERRIESAFTTEAGYAHGMRILGSGRPPRAIFCGNDMIAYGLYRATREHGLSVPADMAVVGFDDNRINAWLAPWLTTVHVPALDFGPAVASLIVGGDPVATPTGDIILPFTLTVRTST